MSSAQQVILVHLIEQQPIGYEFERRRNQWPLHITLVSWFKTYGRQTLDRNLSRFATGVAPVSVRVGEQKLFGSDQDIPVNVIANQKPLAALHRGLLGTVMRTAGVEIAANDEFAGSRYRAHVTRHVTKAVELGDRIQVNDFHLVQLLGDNTCRVEKQYILGQV